MFVGREQSRPVNVAVDGSAPMVCFERELAVGTIGTLWLGRLVGGAESGRIVLVRRMSLDLFTSKDIDSLKKVAEAYGKVRHPSFVKLLGLVEQDQDLVSVSEHLDGVRLNDLLRNAIDTDTPLPATVAVRVVLDVARVAAKAHRIAGELGLFPTPRLFIPEGVFVAAFGGTLLTEIGLLSAIARGERMRGIPHLIAQLAPEELDTAHASSGSPEVFSLGVLLWEMLANRSLFSRDSAKGTLQELQALPIKALNEVERCGLPVPDALAEVVRIATCRQPEQRYATIDQMVQALEQLPAHFIATEHHVAAALRDQAAELLKASHVDHSQTSLTLAFSEVPASRMSTCPPPDEGHNWEPPTFAQAKLVARVPSFGALSGVIPTPEGTSGAAESREADRSPLVADTADEVRVPANSLGILAESGLPIQPRQRSRWAKLGIWGLLAVLLAVVLGVAWWSRTSQRTSIQPDVSAQLGSPPARSELEPALPAGSAMEKTAEVPASTGAAMPNASASKRPKTLEAPAEPPGADPALRAPLPSANRSGSAYRPRQIAPYRPKGI